MEIKLCRFCGKSTEHFQHIFKTEGFKNKLETCLPIVVSPHCLLPDTICIECYDIVDNFYSFTKNCLQNIIILEYQYDIHESCLKTKRKHDKGCLAVYIPKTAEAGCQTDVEVFNFLPFQEKNTDFLGIEKKDTQVKKLVNYDDSDEDNSENVNEDANAAPKTVNTTTSTSKFYDYNSLHYRCFIDENPIGEINESRPLKRKTDTILGSTPKIFKIDTNRRKKRMPVRIDTSQINAETVVGSANGYSVESYCQTDDGIGFAEDGHFTKQGGAFSHVCWLCQDIFSSEILLATHLYESHGVDIDQMIAAQEQQCYKKKLPNLVKISDLKTKDTADEALVYYQHTQQPHQQLNHLDQNVDLSQSITSISNRCPICLIILTTNSDLFSHMRLDHEKESSLVCGLCHKLLESHPILTEHIEACRQLHELKGAHICKICLYGDDNLKLVENHVIVHDFLLTFCKRELKMFDPSDYIDENVDGSAKNLNCSECEFTTVSFKEFSAHRRMKHQIFHCDLCNKSYGRNSHLWKHVNRLHKGHPSITCQICYKTSASKYHLAQHFSKIHGVKGGKPNANALFTEEEEFLNQKFEAFDFQSVKQRFLKQELLQEERKAAENQVKNNSDCEDNHSNFDDSSNEKSEAISGALNTHLQKSEQTPAGEEEAADLSQDLPKEIDSSSNLYTNIITNYTPPQNEGEYKCPKCCKAFHKKPLLKKHKKNCRPKMQKDLLTRCKTCSRIFKDRQSLAKHLVNYHTDYKCEICNQKVQSKCEIVSHIRFTHPKSHLKCHCGNILRTSHDLREHQADHYNSFVCQFCADILSSKIKLKMHILSLHRTILSLSCGICLKLFETQHILRDHVRLVHKNELSPLTSCGVCGKNYGSKWKTYDHMTKSHGKMFKACRSCLEVFETESLLDFHCRTAHVNEIKPNTAKAGNETVTSAISVKKDSMFEEASKNTSGSDYEENSSSDGSNEVMGQFQVKSEINDIGENGVDGLMNHSLPFDASALSQSQLPNCLNDGSTSLLERRLLGQDGNDSKIIETQSNQEVSFTEDFAKSVKSKSKSSASKSKPKPKGDGDDSTSHSSSKRTVYLNSNDPSVCEICMRVWPAKKHLWQHYIRCHKTVAATVCGICLKTNDSYQSLQEHLTTTHPTLLHGQGFGSNFICRICGRYHNASSKLKLHMTIHDNFDWGILDTSNNFQPDIRENGGHNVVEYQESRNDGPAAIGEDINYESLIERVECSSGEESDDNDSEEENEGEYKDIKEEEEGEGAQENLSTSEESINDCSLSGENSLESQMLKNMLIEKETLLTNEEEMDIKDEPMDDEVENVHTKQEYSTSDDETSNNTTSSMSDTDAAQVKSNYTSEDEDATQNSAVSYNVDDYGVCEQKSEELDSAVRSITYQGLIMAENVNEEEYCDIVVPQNLNQREIQSAVNSIL